jgi:subtilisin family serine protease
VVATGTVLAVAAGPLLASPAGAQVEQSAGPAGAGAQQVTLLTGDRVSVGPDGQVLGIERGPGREQMPFSVRQNASGTHVVPRDAEGLIRSGVLDSRLFDVAELSRPEYARTSGDGLPVIVLYDERRSAARAEVRSAAGPKADAELESINGQAFSLDAEEAADTWEALTAEPDASAMRTMSAGVAAVVLDEVVEAALDSSVAQIGVPAAWEAGLDGDGVTVAVLDTGIDSGHPDLAGNRVIAERNFGFSPDLKDRDGHGTHVASILAGTGAGSEGRYTGVAPGVGLINAKVLDDYGFGSTSGIVEGMEWAVEQGADIVNMSLGGNDGAGIDPLEEAVNRLSADSGALFVVAAGNRGPGQLSSPASADAALAVGAVDRDDVLAEFSGTGPRAGDRGAKPDLTAPGVAIAAAASPGSTMEEVGEPVADGYTALSGTSMATPHVAGAAALLKQQHPDWSGERIKAALVASTAAPAAGHDVFGQGTGRVDMARALNQTVVAEQGPVTFGLIPWSGEEPAGETRTLTYRNLGEEEVTLTLTATASGPDERPLHEGLFLLSTDRLTVPASGTAEVQVTAAPALVSQRPGAYGLLVVATGDGQTVRTAGAMAIEEEAYTYTAELLDRQGGPVRVFEFCVEGIEDHNRHVVLCDGARPGSGPEHPEPVSFRLPQGEYTVDVRNYKIDEVTGEYLAIDFLVQPQLEISEDTTAVFDAREAAPVEPTVFDTDAELASLQIQFTRGEEGFGVGIPGPLREGLRSQHVGPAGDERTLAAVSTTWLSGERVYEYVNQQRGRFYTGMTEHIAREDLAELAVAFASPAPLADGTAALSVVAHLETENGPRHLSAGLGTLEDLPGSATRYLGGEGIAWSVAVYQGRVVDGVPVPAGYSFSAEPERFAPGRQYRLTMGNGVFGPAGPSRENVLTRRGNIIQAHLYPLVDGAGNFETSLDYEGSATLYRDGEEIWSQDVPLHTLPYDPGLWPAAEAEYELRSTVRPDLPVSTEVTTSLFFTSGHVPGEEWRDIPFSAVRFTPELAPDATAPADRKLLVPVTVEGSAAGDDLGSLEVEVSYDSGETWLPVSVHRGEVLVDGPPAGGSVSFRAQVSDTGGNRTEQTIIDAYRTR